MNTIKIYLAESGGIANLVKDFSIYQHSYQNKLLNIFVPTSILAPDFTSQLNGVTTGEYVAGTAVKVGMSYTASNGSIKTSESRYLNYIKILTYQNVEYALFERMLPKEFTLYAGQGANAPILTTNVVNVQTDVEEGETPIVLSIITSQTCNLEVMASTILDNEEVVEASELETINARLNSIDGTLAEKQDITDEALDTTSKTIVGGINELKATSDTHTTQIGDNTEDIAENQNDIDYLYSHMAQSEEYIGQMTGSALPSDSALTDFVVANTDPSRQPKNADVIIFILQVSGGTDKNYKYLFSVTSWNGFEIPPVEEASNGTKGILEGTYSVGLTHNTLVNISGGQILNIYVKDTTGTYRDIREYANTLNTTIQSIIAGDTSVGLAVKSLQDGLGNNIVNTYLTQNAGATKQYVRDYSLPREFNDISFIASTGYQDTIPTTPESGIQFSGTSSAVGDLTLFQIEKVSIADFELSSKNSSQNTIYVSADRNCSVYFRLSTQAKNIGQDWVDLSVELSNQISLISGEIYKQTFNSAFSSLGTTVMTLTDNDLIRQTFEVVTQESAETTFDVYSNETYTSSYAMNTQSFVQYIAQGDLGEQPVYEITGELVGGVITFELDDTTILNNNVEARFVLNYTNATVPEDSTEIVLVLNEQNIRLVTPYNLDTGNAIVRYLSQVNNQFTGGVQTWAFKGFIQIDGGDNISIIVDEDNLNFETSTSNIKMDGIVSVGSSSNIARADHIHPSDTAKVDKEYSSDYAYTDGLVFTWYINHYIVGTGSTTVMRNAYPVGTEPNIVIPKYYDDGVHGIRLIGAIGKNAFKDYADLTSIKIPDSVNTIYDFCFKNCSNLTYISMPDEVDFGTNAFENCISLTDIVLPKYLGHGGGSAAFRGCSALTRVVILNINFIDNQLFYGCSALTSITLPEGISGINIRAFYECSSLTNITIPSMVNYIDSYAFHNCSNLTKVYIEALTPPSLDSTAFTSSGITASTGAIYVPYESLTAYKTATGWSTYASRIYPIPDGKDLTDKLNLKLDTSLKGANNGLAELDATGRVPSSQLPSYVDDVIEVANYASLPMIGESDKIYITLDTNLTYRWGGSAYVEISPSLALGETSSTAYRGDKGKTAYDHSQLTSGNPHNVTKTNVGLSNAYNPTAYGGISYGGGADESGISFTDLDTLVYTGSYTCFGTTANVPSASYSWFIQHINSNVGTTSAIQIATAYATTTIIYIRHKISGTWGAWENISPSLKENVINKVTSISSSSTDTQYPTAKCMYDIIGDIETLLAEV